MPLAKALRQVEAGITLKAPVRTARGVKSICSFLFSFFLFFFCPFEGYPGGGALCAREELRVELVDFFFFFFLFSIFPPLFFQATERRSAVGCRGLAGVEDWARRCGRCKVFFICLLFFLYYFFIRTFIFLLYKSLCTTFLIHIHVFIRVEGWACRCGRCRKLANAEGGLGRAARSMLRGFLKIL